MDLSWANFSTSAGRLGRDLLATYWTGAALLQVLAIAAALLLAWALGKRLEHIFESRAHAIRGNADLLRLVIAFIRRMPLVVFVAALFLLRLALFAAGIPTPIVSLILLLAGAWLALAVLTRIIRNRALARSVALAAWLYVAVSVLGLLDPVLAGLELTAVRFGELRISALGVVRTLVVVAIVLWIVLFISRIAENQIARSGDISDSGKVLFGKIVRISLLVAGGALALTATGVDLTALTVISGAVGVGLGFGLQKVVSNFISGIIILLDRSIKPGDTIELGETFGSIRELRARFVSVMTRDGRKYLIPNEDFITQQVINWSYSDRNVRIDVEFGVGYDSDPHQVVALAIAQAKTVKRVTGYREPVCWMTAFGAFSLDFKLRFWITDPENGLTNVRGQVLLALWDAFQAKGVTIPFPQHDVNFKTPLDLRHARRASEPGDD